MSLVGLPNAGLYPKAVVLMEDTRIHLRPLAAGDKLRLLRFFGRVSETDRYYLKENVTAPEVIQNWTADIDFERAIPIVAVAREEIVGDATLHRSRASVRRHIGEVRVVVDPAYREVGLGRRLIREMVDIAVELRLHKVVFELVEKREDAAIRAAQSLGFRRVASLHQWVRDIWGNYEDLVIMELPLKEADLWWRY
ncbi:MAG: GNAT family N-acetyltransferase [Chloroflexi bacterium]|nr:GNAT family N-acetyltransferase [Chloroflexota bacterium]